MVAAIRGICFGGGFALALACDLRLASEEARFCIPAGKLGIAGQINTGYFKYIDRIRDRRYPIYDEEQGIIFGVVFFEHPGNVKTVTVKGMPGVDKVDLAPFTQRPSSAEIAEAFQIEDGKIRTVAAILDPSVATLSDDDVARLERLIHDARRGGQ